MLMIEINEMDYFNAEPTEEKKTAQNSCFRHLFFFFTTQQCCIWILLDAGSCMKGFQCRWMKKLFVGAVRLLTLTLPITNIKY